MTGRPVSTGSGSTPGAAMTEALTWFCTGIRRGGHDRIPLTGVTTRNGKRSLTVVEPCPACGLGPAMLGWRKRQRLAGAGIAEVDISALPF